MCTELSVCTVLSVCVILSSMHSAVCVYRDISVYRTVSVYSAISRSRAVSVYRTVSGYNAIRVYSTVSMYNATRVYSTVGMYSAISVYSAISGWCLLLWQYERVNSSEVGIQSISHQVFFPEILPSHVRYEVRFFFLLVKGLIKFQRQVCEREQESTWTYAVLKQVKSGGIHF